MKIKIDKYEYVKTLQGGFEIELPEEPIAFQAHNYREF